MVFGSSVYRSTMSDAASELLRCCGCPVAAGMAWGVRPNAELRPFSTDTFSEAVAFFRWA